MIRLNFCLFFFGGVFIFIGAWMEVFPLDLVQHGAWLSSWSSFPLVIQVVSSILLLDLSCRSGSFLDFGLSCLWVWLYLHKLGLENFQLTSLPLGMIYSLCLTSNIHFFP